MLTPSEIQFTRQLCSALSEGLATGKAPFSNKTAFEKIAAGYGISDKNHAKELAEFATLSLARTLVTNKNEVWENYQRLIDLYNIQPSLTHRTSYSTIYQQYSTPLPISYLAGVWCSLKETLQSPNLGTVKKGKFSKNHFSPVLTTQIKSDQNSKHDLLVPVWVFEPCAGNGLLTIAFDPEQVSVNEIDNYRCEILAQQGFKELTKKDASKYNFITPDQYKAFDIVISNPPFDRLAEAEKLEGITWTNLDFYMCVLALKALKDNGRAAIIVGGHTTYDHKGRIAKGQNRNFLTYLYEHYNVSDVININGELYRKQGTSFNIRLILIDGRNLSGQIHYPPLKPESNSKEINTFDELYQRVFTLKSNHIQQDYFMNNQLDKLALLLKAKLDKTDSLSGPYDPIAKSCFSLEVNVPDSMDTEVNLAKDRLRQMGDIVEFVRRELRYKTKNELCQALAAEQIDAVAQAIIKMKHGMALIIGDQTGIGKGRQAAAIIRWAHFQFKGDKLPVFITEKKNLFSDIFRDLQAIGSGHLVPFIVNSDAAIKDQDKKILHKSRPVHQKAVFDYYQRKIAEDPDLPSQSPLKAFKYDFIITTYSQFYAKKAYSKRDFLMQVTQGEGTMIMDEAHNVSGNSDSGRWFQKLVKNAGGCVFLSATYAKRPDNMALYAQKTTLKEIGAARFDSIMAKGGMAIQEIIASKLAENGEMVRRERPYENVEVNYLILKDKTDLHRSKADSITRIIRMIIEFENRFVMGRIAEIDDQLTGRQQGVEKSNKDAGVNKTALFSKVFQTIYQMLMAIKVEDVIDRAIQRLKSGYKVVIAFGNTMESFLNEYELEDTVQNNFSQILLRALDGTLKYNIRSNRGSIPQRIELESLGEKAIKEYQRIKNEIRTVSTGVTISPIDIMIQKLEAAGYTVEEVTGRNRRLEFNEDFSVGQVVKRLKRARENQFIDFQNNKTDVLLINQSGSTGASAHAIVTSQVSKDEVRPRAMLVLQPELDINKEIQKRGRINRTGQIYPPVFDYIVSNIPAETRLLMMLKNKLRSLDANTSGSTSTSKKLLDYQDIMNKYGDFVVTQYCYENPEFTRLIGDPLELFGKSTSVEGELPEDEDESIEESTQRKMNSGNDRIYIPEVPEASTRVTGRVAIIPTKMQEEFYTSIFKRYNEYIETLKESGDYDLDVQLFELKARTLEKTILKVGSGSGSPFSGHSFIEKCEVNNLTPPLKKHEIEERIQEGLKAMPGEHTDADEMIKALITQCEDSLNAKTEKLKQEALQRMLDKQSQVTENLKSQDMDDTIRQATLQVRLQILHDEYEQKATDIENQAAFSLREMTSVFNFFRPGKSMDFAIEIYGSSSIVAKSVFIGYKIDFNASSPFNKSNIRLQFAGLEMYRTLTVTLSNFWANISQTIALNTGNFTDYLYRWEELRKESSKGRITAHIITGNIVSALADERVSKGTLIRFTDYEGKVRTGYRLKSIENIEQDNSVTVPCYIARNYIFKKASMEGVRMSKDVFLILYSGVYTLKVPRSKQEGGDIYQDTELLIEAGTQFEASGDAMVMKLSGKEAVFKVLKYLQEQHSINVSVPRSDFKMIEDAIPEDVPEMEEFLNEVGINTYEQQQQSEEEEMELMLQIKAKALALKLKLQL